jgi:Leucine-rich repeat (LRR) protein
LWPTFHQCYLSEVDFSKSYESEIHSFSGSSSQKSQATVVYFFESSKFDFIPKEIPKEFPNLNGLIFLYCNLTVLKNEFFSEDFVVALEYLDLGRNQIVSIEPSAFQNLKNLKHLNLQENKIQSLFFNLFQNNLKLIYLNFWKNQINSISPNLLKNLNQLKQVDFQYNQCVDQSFACSSCPISQSDLDSGLSLCFQNCLKDPDCATKSETTPQVTTTPPTS